MQLLSARTITTILNNNDKDRLSDAVKSMVYYAHKDGNITPILDVFARTVKDQLADGRKMLNYLKDHAPVTYNKDTKAIELDRSKRDVGFLLDDAEALPHLFEKAKREPKWTGSNFKSKIKKFELATDDELELELATVKAYMAELKAARTARKFAPEGETFEGECETVVEPIALVS